MQDQRDVLGLGGAGPRRGPSRLAREAEGARAALGIGRQRQYRDPEFPGRRERRGGAARLDDERLRAEIAHVEFELVGAIGRIERRGRRAGRDAEESGRHFRPVGQDDRDAVVAADPEGR